VNNQDFTIIKNSSIKSGNIANYKMVTLLQWQSKTQKLLILRFGKWLHQIIGLSKQRMRVTMLSTLHLLYSLTQFFKAHWLCILQLLTCMCKPNRNSSVRLWWQCITFEIIYFISFSTVSHWKNTTKKLIKHHALGTGSMRSVLEKIDLER